MRRDTPLSLFAPVHVFDDPIHSSSCLSTLNQKTNKNIRILYSLKYKYSKKKSLRKINGSVGWSKHSVEQY